MSAEPRRREAVPDTRPGSPRRSSGRILGIIPNSRKSRLFFLWAIVNVVLSFLPVWDVAFNNATIAGGFLPVTILWSYLVFTSNLLLAIGVYFGWARSWAARADAGDHFALQGDGRGDIGGDAR